MKVYKTENKIIKSWATNLEDGALSQAENLARLPFTYKHVALMPDCHQGYGMPIGGVLATKDVIVPSGCGVDIGCGMGFIQTNIPIDLIRNTNTSQGPLLKEMLSCTKRNIPTGFSKHKEPKESVIYDSAPIHLKVISENIESSKYSLGTGGGGNHFLEIQEDENENLCLMLHSGSRNFGYKVAEYYNKKAIELNKKYHSVVDEKQDLAFLPIDSQEGIDYLDAMNFALCFAKENRRFMLEKFKSIVFNLIKKHTDLKTFEVLNEINIHHNYVALENHFGENVYVHRKGAIRMRKDELGIIPGSMGTHSYIVKGLGNDQSFHSASHGAGRAMGRMQANRSLSIEKEKSILDKMGVTISSKNIDNILDECPSAYKDIDEVIENQKDLVDVIIKLKPVGSVKGEGKKFKKGK